MHVFSFFWLAISIGQLANEKRKLLGSLSSCAVFLVEFFIRKLVEKLLRTSFYDSLRGFALDGSLFSGGAGTINAYLVTELVFFALETFGIWYVLAKKLNLS